MNNPKRGFTLIELLVVIAIIALLLAILMPSLQAVKKQAKSVICLTNLRSLGQWFNLYTVDNNDRFPFAEKNASSSQWKAIIENYRLDKQASANVYICPTATKNADEGAKQPFVAYSNNPRVSYGLNRWIYDVPSGGSNSSSFPNKWRWRTPLNAGSHANYVPLLADSDNDGGFPLEDDIAPEYYGHIEKSWGDGDHMTRFVFDRHPRHSVNVVFFDWSARSVRLKELWYLKWHRNYKSGTPRNGFPGSDISEIVYE